MFWVSVSRFWKYTRKRGRYPTYRKGRPSVSPDTFRWREVTPLLRAPYKGASICPLSGKYFGVVCFCYGSTFGVYPLPLPFVLFFGFLVSVLYVSGVALVCRFWLKCLVFWVVVCRCWFLGFQFWVAVSVCLGAYHRFFGFGLVFVSVRRFEF